MTKDYLIVILNYNSYEDTLVAVKSCVEMHRNDNYIICVADNNSTEKINKNELENIGNNKVEILEFDQNYGYAKGNNIAINEMTKKYLFKNECIMNTDIID